MDSISLTALAEIVSGELRGNSEGARVERVSVDSRHVTPGTLFVALSGGRTDGHRFVGEALARGAAAAVVARSWAELPEAGALIARGRSARGAAPTGGLVAVAVARPSDCGHRDQWQE